MVSRKNVPASKAAPKPTLMADATPGPTAAPTPAPGDPGYGSVLDRRTGVDRREAAKMRAARLRAGSVEGQSGTDPSDEDLEQLVTGLERRRGPGRRLSDFTRAAEEGELTQEQFLFVMAIESFKRANDTMFPTWCDVLEVVRLLGYRKTMASELNLRNAEDWRESPLSAANVRPPRWLEHGQVDAQRAAADARTSDRTQDQTRRAA